MLNGKQEFDQVKVRDDELVELDKLKKLSCRYPVKSGAENSSGKTNILLQSYISNNARVSSFTLISDTNYVAQNASRVTRALFEICLKKGWAIAAEKMLAVAKSIDQRIWWHQTPLRQFNTLPVDSLYKLEENSIDVFKLFTLSASEIGNIVGNPHSGDKVKY